MNRAAYDAEQAKIPGTWQHRQGHGLDEGTDEPGIPGGGIVLAVAFTLLCIAVGWLLSDFTAWAIRRWS